MSKALKEAIEANDAEAVAKAAKKVKDLNRKLPKSTTPLLLRTMPERYRYHEGKEQEIRDTLGDVSIMADRSGDGVKKPLTMRMFRERIEAGAQIDMFEIGGCGCFVDEPDEPAAL